jgi:hypothetical protein
MTSIDLTNPLVPVWNTPVADPADPNDNPYECGGLGEACLTVELGSLYDVAVPTDSPLTSDDLFTLTVSEGCNMIIDVNAHIGGIMMEDTPPAPPSAIVSAGCTIASGECYVVGQTRWFEYDGTPGPNITQAQYDLWKLTLSEPQCWCCPWHGLGDGNGDGAINASDYIPIFNNKDTATTPATACADVNHDGAINASDYILIFNHKDTGNGVICPPLP